MQRPKVKRPPMGMPVLGGQAPVPKPSCTLQDCATHVPSMGSPSGKPNCTTTGIQDCPKLISRSIGIPCCVELSALITAASVHHLRPVPCSARSKPRLHAQKLIVIPVGNERDVQIFSTKINGRFTFLFCFCCADHGKDTFARAAAGCGCA